MVSLRTLNLYMEIAHPYPAPTPTLTRRAVTIPTSFRNFQHQCSIRMKISVMDTWRGASSMYPRREVETKKKNKAKKTHCVRDHPKNEKNKKNHA